MLNDKVLKNIYGFFELSDKPSETELQDYYKNKYYQESKSTYSRSYSNEEIIYFNNKLEQKYQILIEQGILDATNKRFLDIGCGEGWGLSFFQKRGWNVKGLDHSVHGCKTHNPEMLKFLDEGDPIQSLKRLGSEGQRYDVLWLDNVLEHLIDPLGMLEYCLALLSNEGLLVIEVPNDFSVVQKELLSNGNVKEPFWIVSPDHISYFNSDGLIELCKTAGLNCVDMISDYAIDFDLFNSYSNYKTKPEVGKESHNARVKVENLLHNISIEKTNKLYRLYAEMGIGRQITGFFKRSEKAV